MPVEKKSGVMVCTRIAPSLHKKFRSKLKKENRSVAQWVRDQIQLYLK